MSEFPPESRASFARHIRRMRHLERVHGMPSEETNRRRNRPAEKYVERLQGLQATLDHVRRLNPAVLADLGAGTSRGISQIANSAFGERISFLGTGLLWDPAIDAHLGRSRYRLTPAERMRGFAPKSLAGCLSVYGPFHYSHEFMPQVFDRLTDCLVDEGVIKACTTWHVTGASDTPEWHNAVRQEDCERIQKLFGQYGYAYAALDHQEPFDPKARPDEAERWVTTRVYLGVKIGQRGQESARLTAERLIQEDQRSIDKMKAAFVEGS